MRTVDEWKTLLRDGILAARKARDPIRGAAYKETLAAIEDAAAPPLDEAQAPVVDGAIAGTAGGLYAGEVARRHLSPDEARAVVLRVIEERRAMAAEFTAHGRDDAAKPLLDEATVLDTLIVDDAGP